MFQFKRFNPAMWSSALFLVFVSSWAIFAGAAELDPWSLRDHYSFKGEHATFKMDVKSAEWMVEVAGRGTVVDAAQCEIEFADGEVLRLSSLEAVKDGREKFSGPIGDGTYFRSTFRTNESLEIEYSVARFTERPFLLLHVTLRNRGSDPIEIASVRPVVLEAGSVSNLGSGATVTRLGAGRRGIFPVVYENGDASLVRFSLRDPDVTLGMGLLQTGLMDSSIHVQSTGDTWEGTASCVYSPTLTIQPGELVGSDPVWMSFSLGATQSHEFHTWTDSLGTPSLNLDAVPSAWITVDANLPATTLYEAAGKWAEEDIQYVLVPSGWEEKPGSLRGSKPNYPRDMSRVASEILGMRMRPGISIDPLAIKGAEEGWSVTDSAGQTWLDLTNQRAVFYGVEQMRSVVGWGFQFFVVEASRIPDEVLHQLNLTRAKADSMALDMVARAAQGHPVFPSAALSLGDDVARWQGAAASTAFFATYGMVAGPVRFRVDDLAELPRGLADAIAQYAGPVEYVGYPKRKVRRNLVSLREAAYASN